MTEQLMRMAEFDRRLILSIVSRCVLGGEVLFAASVDGTFAAFERWRQHRGEVLQVRAAGQRFEDAERAYYALLGEAAVFPLG